MMNDLLSLKRFSFKDIISMLSVSPANVQKVNLFGIYEPIKIFYCSYQNFSDLTDTKRTNCCKSFRIIHSISILYQVKLKISCKQSPEGGGQLHLLHLPCIHICADQSDLNVVLEPRQSWLLRRGNCLLVYLVLHI